MEAAAVCGTVSGTVSGMRVGAAVCVGSVRVICVTSMIVVTMISVLICTRFNLHWTKCQSEPHAEGVVRSDSCGEHANPAHPRDLQRRL
jgi:hypothetical protein